LYGIGVNIKTGEIFPATFPDKGPDLPLRHSRIFSGSPALLEIYDYSSGLLRIGPFHYEPLRCADIMLQESDDFILQHLTTSPEVEPAHIVNEVNKICNHFLSKTLFEL
jgi:protein N-terminal asparagine amidohydrolase